MPSRFLCLYRPTWNSPSQFGIVLNVIDSAEQWLTGYSFSIKSKLTPSTPHSHKASIVEHLSDLLDVSFLIFRYPQPLIEGLEKEKMDSISLPRGSPSHLNQLHPDLLSLHLAYVFVWFPQNLYDHTLSVRVSDQ